MTSNNPVRTRRLGQTGLDVGELGLGTAATVKLEPFEVSECLRFALEHGVNFVDTAPVYGNEALFGEAMSGLRDRLVVATKVGGMQNIQEHRNSGALMEQFHGTLKQLKSYSSNCSLFVELLTIRNND